MHISFHSKHLRSICKSESYAKEILGVQLSKKLLRRIFDIDATQNILSLPVGNPKSSFQDGEEYIIVCLDSSTDIGFTCGHTTPPKNADGSVDWSNVSRIKLMFIGDEK